MQFDIHQQPLAFRPVFPFRPHEPERLAVFRFCLFKLRPGRQRAERIGERLWVQRDDAWPTGPRRQRERVPVGGQLDVPLGSPTRRQEVGRNQQIAQRRGVDISRVDVAQPTLVVFEDIFV